MSLERLILETRWISKLGLLLFFLHCVCFTSLGPSINVALLPTKNRLAFVLRVLTLDKCTKTSIRCLGSVCFVYNLYQKLQTDISGGRKKLRKTSILDMLEIHFRTKIDRFDEFRRYEECNDVLLPL